MLAGWLLGSLLWLLHAGVAISHRHRFVESQGSSTFWHRPQVPDRRSGASTSSPACVDCLYHLSYTMNNLLLLFTVKPKTHLLYGPPFPSVVISILWNLSALMYSASSWVAGCIFQQILTNMFIHPTYILLLKNLTNLPLPKKRSLCALLWIWTF